MEKLLQIKDLNVEFTKNDVKTYAVNGISFDVYENQSLGIVGESGSGKSVTAKTILNLIAKISKNKGKIIYKGKNLLDMTEKEINVLRGDDIAMVFQDPMTSLNPLFTIKTQFRRLIKRHRKNLSNKEADSISIKYLNLVGIAEAEKRIKSYPHEFSGGMRQRVMIAMALCLDPKLIIADEPTTALDVTIQAQVLNLLNDIRENYKNSLILISHDLGVIANTCDRIIVMYGGRIMEEADCYELFKNPKHPYTRGLMQSMPKLGSRERLKPIGGNPPVINEKLRGCPFYPRCPKSKDICKQENPRVSYINDRHKIYCWLYEE